MRASKLLPFLCLAVVALVFSGCGETVSVLGSCVYPEDIGTGVGDVCQANFHPTDCEGADMQFHDGACSDIGFPTDCGDDLWVTATTNCADVH